MSRVSSPSKPTAQSPSLQVLFKDTIVPSNIGCFRCKCLTDVISQILGAMRTTDLIINS